jgi:hypothetical protein
VAARSCGDATEWATAVAVAVAVAGVLDVAASIIMDVKDVAAAAAAEEEEEEEAEERANADDEEDDNVEVTNGAESGNASDDDDIEADAGKEAPMVLEDAVTMGPHLVGAGR